MNKVIVLAAGVVVVGVATAQTETVERQACQRSYATTVSNCAKSLDYLDPNERAGTQQTCVHSAMARREACLVGVTKVRFNSMVTFGASLSDVGAYKVGTVAALGGGKYTVNGPDGLTWTEVLAKMVGAPPQCAAQTGLLPNISGVTGAPVQNFDNCFNYAQGSSRVSSSGTGPAGVALQTALAQRNVGLMCISLREQVGNHLAKVGGYFQRTDLVTVEAGGNDLFTQLTAVSSAAGGGAAAVATGTVAGWPQATLDVVILGGPAALDAARAAAVKAMDQAGAELAALINTQIVGRGAWYVVVRNLGNVAYAPLGRSVDAATQAFVVTMTQAFNSRLNAGLTNSAGALPYGVIIFDQFTLTEAVAADPARFGFSNNSSPACGPNAFGGNALVCNSTNLVPGDTSRYAFADLTHPTPYWHRLAAELVMSRMVVAGWQ